MDNSNPNPLLNLHFELSISKYPSSLNFWRQTLKSIQLLSAVIVAIPSLTSKDNGNCDGGGGGQWRRCTPSLPLIRSRRIHQ